MYKYFLVFTALLSTTGCGTVVKLIDPTEPYVSYAGIKYDLEMAQVWGLPVLDLPMSFLLDTALLPYVWSQQTE